MAEAEFFRNVVEAGSVGYDFTSGGSTAHAQKEVSNDEVARAFYEIMYFWHQLAEEAGIDYFLFAGSALSAERHGTQCPWDTFDWDVLVEARDKLKLMDALDRAAADPENPLFWRCEWGGDLPRIFHKNVRPEVAWLDVFLFYDTGGGGLMHAAAYTHARTHARTRARAHARTHARADARTRALTRSLTHPHSHSRARTQAPTHLPAHARTQPPTHALTPTQQRQATGSCPMLAADTPQTPPALALTLPPPRLHFVPRSPAPPPRCRPPNGVFSHNIFPRPLLSTSSPPPLHGIYVSTRLRLLVHVPNVPNVLMFPLLLQVRCSPPAGTSWCTTTAPSRTCARAWSSPPA